MVPLGLSVAVHLPVDTSPDQITAVTWEAPSPGFRAVFLETSLHKLGNCNYHDLSIHRAPAPPLALGQTGAMERREGPTIPGQHPSAGPGP